MESKRFYVYRHIRLDTNTPFYVGKGQYKSNWNYQKESSMYNRAFRKSYRNDYWTKIEAKYGREVEIIMDGLTEEEAFAKEIEFIKMYKALGYCEANFTDGGEGVSGYKFTPEHSAKMSKSLKGKMKGKKNPNYGLRGRDNPNYGSKRSKETRLKQSKQKKGKKLSKEHRKNISKATAGKNNPRSRKVQQISTGKIFDCIKDGAKELGYNWDSTRATLSRQGYFRDLRYYIEEGYNE